MHPFVFLLLLAAFAVNIKHAGYLLQPFFVALIVCRFAYYLSTKLQNTKLSYFIEVLFFLLVLYGLTVSFLPKVFIFLAFGILLNLSVMFANGFQMPVCHINFRRAFGDATLSFQHHFIDNHTKLDFLADRIIIPGLGVSSIGDIFLNIGCFLAALELILA